MIRPATPADVPAIATLIRRLADYERLAHAVDLDPADLRAHLFGATKYAEVLLAEEAGAAVGYALFFHTYSTFRGKPGVHFEDLFVEPAHRGRGHGTATLRALARPAVGRGAPGSSGRCWTGTSRRSGSTRPSAPRRWTSGPSTG